MPTDGAMTLSAGAFGAWLSQARAALHGDGGADVPCGDCVGCCVSSYHIPIRPTDRAARDAIPIQYLQRVSMRPDDPLMLGYLDDGLCPMLKQGRCSIYAQRPQTCRDYDCRVFAAAGIEAGDAAKRVINERVRAWRFNYATDVDRELHAAVRAAAAFIQSKREAFPQGCAPKASTGVAVLAIKTYEVFMTDLSAKSDADIARALLDAAQAFDAAPAAAMQPSELRERPV